ncbi:helix-turn-helix transcriptional regulator [Streptomyces sp. N50]|uniref:helix-turn-helix transcriptional regulator n=1 Tax=Streptomyces sp. N50 TaxID=3081765 RepID=UPI00296224B2|nr:AAA family ATPase [Streptomyces sp. N50]WOX15281.1 AAA family ATPase [Streptomyces sp. N50]
MERSGEERLPFVPPGLSAPRFVGRAAELHRLTDALARPPAAVLVEGEAGIGKSRLVQEALEEPGIAARRPLSALCPPFREALTLGPVVDAAREARPDVAELALTPLAGVLRPLFPEWTQDLPPSPETLSDAGAARHRLFRALAELLDAMGVGVLVLEDVHWADEATLDFLMFLASRRSRRMSLVLTYRPEDVAPDSTLMRLTSRPPAGTGYVRIGLGALDVPQTAELMSSMLDGEHVSEAFASFLQERTDGVPLAIEESVRLLRDRADLVRRDGEWVRRTLADIAVPPTIRDAVAERASRLTPVAQRVLQAASVLAEPVGSAVLATVSGLPNNVVGEAVDAAVRSGLLGEDRAGRVRFRHALAARAVYDMTPAPDRRALHREAGRALWAVTPQPVARLAHHYREAGDIGQWRQYAERTADLALASGDHRTAVGLLHELLTESDPPAASVARWAQKMPVLAFNGLVARGDLTRALRRVLDTEALAPHDRAAVRTQLGRMLLHTGEYAAGAAELERALPDLADEPFQAAWAMNTLGAPPSTLMTAGEHRRWLDRAADAARLPMTADQRLALAVDRATALLDMGDEVGWDVVAELPDTATTPEGMMQLTRGGLNIGNGAMRWGRYDQARALLTTGLARAEGHRYRRLHDMILVTLVHLDWFTGAWDGLAERAAALAEVDEEPLLQLDALLVTALLDGAVGGGDANRGQVAVAEGGLGTVEERLRQVLDAGLRRGIVDVPLEPAAALARIRLAEGSAAEALELTEGPADVVARKNIWLWATEFAPVRTGALLAVERPDQARRFVADLAEGLAGKHLPAAHAALETCLGVLAEGEGRSAEAATAFGRAATAWTRLPRPYEALLATERRAGCLLTAGDRDTGLAELARAQAGFTALGARTDADRVHAALRAAGAPVRQVWRGGRRGYGDQLSPRELEVVRLLLTGLTNPAIARALSRSPKTVAAQLNSAMRKYGVTSRTALAVSLTQAGITPSEGHVAGTRSDL